MNGCDLRRGLAPLAAVLLAGMVAALPAILSAQPARGGGTAVAEATVYEGGVDFRPNVQHAGGVITVSGNGLVFQRAIAPGQAASIGVFDAAGELLPDGVYTWELELRPDARTAKQLRRSAERNNGPAPGAWQRLNGSFAIRNGLVAAPDLIETGAAARPASSGSWLPEAVGGPSAARGPTIDDDLAVGTRLGVEADVQAAAAAVEGAAQVGPSSPERSDAAALALGGTLERGISNPAVSEGGPVRRSTFDNTENGANGRDRSAHRQ